MGSDFEVDAGRKEGRPRRTCRRQVEDESVKVGLRMEDALFRSKWIVGVNQINAGHPHLLGLLPHFTTTFYKLVSLSLPESFSCFTNENVITSMHQLT